MNTTSHPMIATPKNTLASLTGLGSATLLALCTTVHAASWTGATSTDWNTATNWSGDTLPAGGGAAVTTNSGNIATISANSTFTPNDLEIACGSDPRPAASITWPVR